MKKLLFSFMLICYSFVASAQLWDFVYDSVPILGRDVCKTNDSCYVAISTNSPFDPGISLKLDRNGNILWTTPYGGLSIKQTYDNGYIIAGWEDDPAMDAKLTKIDGNGNFKWEHTYDGGQQDEFHAVIASSDSCYVACGYTQSYGDSNIYIVKTDSVGNFLWKRSFNSMDYGIAKDLIEINNYYYVSGVYRNFSNNYFLVLIKLNSDGTTVWRKDYQTNYITGYSINLTSDSCLIVAGASILTKLNLNGDSLWCENLNPYWGIYDVSITLDNSFILSGYLDDSINLGLEYNLLVKTDSSGNILWYNTYPGASNYNYMDVFESVTTNYDNGYIACGYSTYDDSTGTSFNRFRVISTDDNGNITGQNEISFNKNIICIYPNPANNQLTIIARNEATKQSLISIYNLQGKQVKSIKCKGQNKKLIVNIEDLPTGLYLLKVTGDKGTEVTKFVKN